MEVACISQLFCEQMTGETVAAEVFAT